ncbi:LuxR C-terminal-related transcriptional regulator [Mycobacterium lentiflavum]|uniref:LuxR C-terminal-related transcriptional regulator n=1 Tax=Mycobacterium lentiflavum TaxID=141349 RepID=A0ABY3UVZ5_MYCLN|nr:LuxR C-terminal-related transcriptional regulator [Mycobacterium lentiflavum]ULP43757.1 LuxR C-terminal-related transcriptional regulator [Mycobacterium lentiflavum]
MPVGEELTPKELEVLRLLRTRLTRTEIGARLYVSLNTVRATSAPYRKLRVEHRGAAVRLLGRVRRAGGSRWSGRNRCRWSRRACRWAHGTRRAHGRRRPRRTRGAGSPCRGCRARRGCRSRRRGGRGSRQAGAYATPVRHIFRVLLERWRTALPRREIGAGIEQIAGHVDLLSGLGVSQTLRRRLAMGLDGNEGRQHRHRHRAERAS